MELLASFLDQSERTGEEATKGFSAVFYNCLRTDDPAVRMAEWDRQTLGETTNLDGHL